MVGRQAALLRVELLLSSIRALRPRTRLDRALIVQTALLLFLSAITIMAPFVLLSRLTSLASRALNRLWQVALEIVVESFVPVVAPVAPVGAENNLENKTSSTVVIFRTTVSRAWSRPRSKLVKRSRLSSPTWKGFFFPPFACRRGYLA